MIVPQAVTDVYSWHELPEHWWSGTSLFTVTRRQASREWPSSTRKQPHASPAGTNINELACDISTKQTQKGLGQACGQKSSRTLASLNRILRRTCVICPLPAVPCDACGLSMVSPTLREVPLNNDTQNLNWRRQGAYPEDSSLQQRRYGSVYTRHPDMAASSGRKIHRWANALPTLLYRLFESTKENTCF
jgi:hypothetical protein